MKNEHKEKALGIWVKDSESLLVMWGVVSNSLHFLCAYADLHFDAQYYNYEIDFNTLLFGIDDYKQDIYVLDSNNMKRSIQIHYFRDIEIDNNNHINIKQKEKEMPFSSFEDYYNRLKTAIENMVNNSCDKERKFKYDLVSTVSKGYDAPCCATMAHKCGCETAVTFSDVGKYTDDSGVIIAEQLGYKNIIERDADSYLNNDSMVEIEALASGDLGTDFQFSAFDDIYAGRLVFIGERGDKIWEKNYQGCNDVFAFNDIITGAGAQERRLWVGYIIVPMPLFGASSWTSIQKISKSKEMDAWSVNNDYDRPIPRRICEEAGIARETFGQKKHGAGIVLRYDWGSRAKSRMSVSASKSFTEYVEENKKAMPLKLIQYFWKARKIYLDRIGIRLPDGMSSTEKSQIANTTIVRYLFPWAASHMIDRYKRILGDS